MSEKQRIKFLIDGCTVLDFSPLQFYMQVCLGSGMMLREGSRFTCMVLDGDIKIMVSDEIVTYEDD